jgi:hypothetical protein
MVEAFGLGGIGGNACHLESRDALSCADSCRWDPNHDQESLLGPGHEGRLQLQEKTGVIDVFWLRGQAGKKGRSRGCWMEQSRKSVGLPALASEPLSGSQRPLDCPSDGLSLPCS